MKYIACNIKPDYTVWIQEDRYLEFTQRFFLGSEDQLTKNYYLYDCIMEGWIKREPQE